MGLAAQSLAPSGIESGSSAWESLEEEAGHAWLVYFQERAPTGAGTTEALQGLWRAHDAVWSWAFPNQWPLVKAVLVVVLATLALALGFLLDLPAHLNDAMFKIDIGPA